MAITYRAGTGVAAGTRTNTTGTKPTGTTTSDMLVAFHSAGGTGLTGPTVSGPTGWTLRSTAVYGKTGDNYSVRYTMWTAPSTVSALTWTHASLMSALWIGTYIGVDNTTPMDVTPSSTVTPFASITTGTTATAASITTVTADTMLVVGRGSWGGTAITAPAGWTERADDGLQWTGDSAKATAGATGSVAVNSGNGGIAGDPWGIILAALRPAVTGTGTVDGTPTTSASVSDTVTVIGARPWVNRTLVQAPRNGTSSHTINFNPAVAGNLLVAFMGGGVTSTTPSGWTLRSSAINNTGLYCWTKTAASGESSFSTTHNGSDYPVPCIVYEFYAGSAYAAQNNSNAANTTDPNPSVTLSSGTTYTIFAAVSVGDGGAGGAPGSVAWTAPAIENADLSVDSITGADGYLFSLAYQAGVTGVTSATLTPTVTMPGGAFGGNERVTIAVTVVAPPAGATAVDGTQTTSASDSDTATTTATGTVVGTQTTSASVSDTGAAVATGVVVGTQTTSASVSDTGATVATGVVVGTQTTSASVSDTGATVATGVVVGTQTTSASVSDTADLTAILTAAVDGAPTTSASISDTATLTTEASVVGAPTTSASVSDTATATATGVVVGTQTTSASTSSTADLAAALTPHVTGTPTTSASISDTATLGGAASVVGAPTTSASISDTATLAAVTAINGTPTTSASTSQLADVEAIITDVVTGRPTTSASVSDTATTIGTSVVNGRPTTSTTRSDTPNPTERVDDPSRTVLIGEDRRVLLVEPRPRIIHVVPADRRIAWH